MVIKPSGVTYDKLTPENMVIADMRGKAVKKALIVEEIAMTAWHC